MDGPERLARLLQRREGEDPDEAREDLGLHHGREGRPDPFESDVGTGYVPDPASHAQSRQHRRAGHRLDRSGGDLVIDLEEGHVIALERPENIVVIRAAGPEGCAEVPGRGRIGPGGGGTIQ